MRRLFTALFLFSVPIQALAQSFDVSVAETTNLIKHARPNVKDAQGWATDLIDVLHLNSLPQTKENICASIAVIDQESNFVADPEVAGLGALAYKSLKDKLDRIPILGRVVLNFLDSHPQGSASYLQRIKTARTEHDLDRTYRSMVEDAGNTTNLSFVIQSGLLNQIIEERNNISTVGSMQVSVRYAVENAKARRWLPMTLSDVYAVRDQLYTRHGGMYYGIKQLLGYNSGYDKKIYRFADFNAGRYSSRNAAFQHLINILNNQNHQRDGDLLLYGKDGKSLTNLSKSEQSLRDIAKANNLPLTEKQIRADLETEKQDLFATTQTYITLKNLYLTKTGHGAPFAEIPGIDLSSPKITHRMTTVSYATSVEKRYNKCITFKP
jgi:Protein of unknown function (DUF1615)